MTTAKKGPAKKLELVLRTGPRASRALSLGEDDPRNRREAQKAARPEVARILEYDPRDQDILRNKLLAGIGIPVTIQIGQLSGGRPGDISEAISGHDADVIEQWVQSININFTLLTEALAATQDQFAELIEEMQDQELMDSGGSELET